MLTMTCPGGGGPLPQRPHRLHPPPLRPQEVRALSARARTITSCSGGAPKKLLRSLQPNGNYHLTKLGKSFFKDKWVDWVVHVPVIIRGIRRNGRNRGMPYERTKRLPVTDLNVTLPRQSEGLSDARNLKASALAQLGNPEPNDIICGSCPTRPTTWTQRGSGPSASRPCRS